jgi:hypothetical protein
MSCHLEAMAKTLAHLRSDRRCNVALLADGSAVAYLPIWLGHGVYGCDVVALEPGASRQAAKLNGETLFAGNSLHTFDGDLLVDAGLRDGPEIQTIVPSAGGITLPTGMYQYCAIWEWYDAGGRRHRSPPCRPYVQTYSDAWAIAHVYCYPREGQWLATQTAGRQGVLCVVYRTTKDGTIFYRLPVAANVNAQSVDGYACVDVIDTFSDATIVTGEVLYTQGDRGGASGLLPNDPPPPCRYVCSGNDRAMIGGLEQRNEVRWSKLVYPGEGIAWSDDMAFRAQVPGTVTGVAFLDGAWYIFTREAIFQISGGGPDDTGSGAFSEARIVQSEVGCIDGRSIVSTGDGILFQAGADRIYLLPRGGNTPIWISQQVRDVLAAYPTIVGAAVVAQANAIALACVRDNGHGAIVWYDVRTHEWMHDELLIAPTTLATQNGALLISGQVLETPGAYAENPRGLADAAALTYEIVTGDIRPFGPEGQGRVRKVVILGEYRAQGSLTVYVSYDAGLTWTDYATYGFGPFDSHSVGEEFAIEHRLKYVRGCPYRFKIQVTCGFGFTGSVHPTEGATISALSFELFPSAGTRRLPAAQIVG